MPDALDEGAMTLKKKLASEMTAEEYHAYLAQHPMHYIAFGKRREMLASMTATIASGLVQQERFKDPQHEDELIETAINLAECIMWKVIARVDG